MTWARKRRVGVRHPHGPEHDGCGTRVVARRASDRHGRSRRGRTHGTDAGRKCTTRQAPQPAGRWRHSGGFQASRKRGTACLTAPPTSHSLADVDTKLPRAGSSISTVNYSSVTRDLPGPCSPPQRARRRASLTGPPVPTPPDTPEAHVFLSRRLAPAMRLRRGTGAVLGPPGRAAA